VDATGKVTAVGAGTATITARAVNGDDVKATKTVTVYIIPVEDIGIWLLTDDDGTHFDSGVGETKQWGVSVTPLNATNRDITFESSDPAVATIERVGVEGNWRTYRVTGVAPGTATITFSSTDGSGVAESQTVTQKATLTAASRSGEE
jgi:uncharacterized protein YjdB